MKTPTETVQPVASTDLFDMDVVTSDAQCEARWEIMQIIEATAAASCMLQQARDMLEDHDNVNGCKMETLSAMAELANAGLQIRETVDALGKWVVAVDDWQSLSNARALAQPGEQD